MSYDPHKRADIVMEGPDKAPFAVKELPVAKPTQAESEFNEQMEHMMNDITSFVFEGRSIRAEVEGLIVWRREMGEGTGSQTWGPVQQNHAAHWISFQRERLAKLKAAIEAKRKDAKDASKIIESVFSKDYPSQYPAELTKQAVAELGII